MLTTTSTALPRIASRAAAPPPPPPPAAPPTADQQALADALAKAEPAILDVMTPVIQLAGGIDLTSVKNKVISNEVQQFSTQVMQAGATINPYKSYDAMMESWLAATKFHQVGDTHEGDSMLPGLLNKAVDSVIQANYKVSLVVGSEGWGQKAITSPQSGAVQTDYNKSEMLPTNAVYLLEDDKGNHLTAEVNGNSVTVSAHDDQHDLVDTFYSRVDDWMAKNNFYKNKILKYNGQLQFMQGLGDKKTTWADIALDPASEQLIKSNTVDFLKNIEVYKENGKFANRNLLMFGPPGTGKSMVNDILFSTLQGQATFLYVTSDTIANADAVQGIFQAARAMQPSFIILEDLDLVGSHQRGDQGAKSDILNELLNQMSGVQDNTGLVVVGTSNQPGDFDEALLRPLRFSTLVPMLLPDEALRLSLLQKITRTQQLAPDVDLKALAAQTDKFSGAGLTEMNEMAIQNAIETGSIDKNSKVILRKQDYDKALEIIAIKEQYLAQAKDPTHQGVKT